MFGVPTSGFLVVVDKSVYLWASAPVMVTSDTERQPSRNIHHAIATVSMIGITMIGDMTPTIENIRSKVQVTLDKLMSEHLLPFKLTAQEIRANGPGNYLVPFYDSRIYSFAFSWTGESSSLEEVVRAAVLERVKAMDGPPHGWGA